MSKEREERVQLIERFMAEYPEPTEEQYEFARTLVKQNCDMPIDDLMIRLAVRSSIHRFTLKFDQERFWEVLPDYIKCDREMREKEGKG